MHHQLLCYCLRELCFELQFYHKYKIKTVADRSWQAYGDHEMGVNSFVWTSRALKRTCLVSLIIVLRSIWIFRGDVMLNLSRLWKNNRFLHKGVSAAMSCSDPTVCGYTKFRRLPLATANSVAIISRIFPLR